MRKQSNSNFWGTGNELVNVRNTKDALAFEKFFIKLSRNLYGKKYDYSKVRFRGLNIKVKLIDKKTSEIEKITPWKHLIKEVEMVDNDVRKKTKKLRSELLTLQLLVTDAIKKYDQGMETLQADLERLKKKVNKIGKK